MKILLRCQCGLNYRLQRSEDLQCMQCTTVRLPLLYGK